MQFQPILNTIFSKFSQEHAPGAPRRPDKVFLAAKWLQKVFKIDFPPKKKSYRTEPVGKKYEHVVKLFIDLNYGVQFKIDSPPPPPPPPPLPKKNGFWLFHFMSVETTVFTRYVFIFSKLSSFNLIVV